MPIPRTLEVNDLNRFQTHTIFFLVEVQIQHNSTIDRRGVTFKKSDMFYVKGPSCHKVLFILVILFHHLL